MNVYKLIWTDRDRSRFMPDYFEADRYAIEAPREDLMTSVVRFYKGDEVIGTFYDIPDCILLERVLNANIQE